MTVHENILLVQMPPWGVTAPPVGPAYLAAYLHSQNIPTLVMDLNIALYRSVPPQVQERWSTAEFEYWASGTVLADGYVAINDIVDSVLEHNPPIIGFSATFASIPLLNAVVAAIRERRADVVIIVGGGGPSYRIHRDHLRRDVIDYCIIGEGEVVLAELITKITTGTSLYIEEHCEQWCDNERDRAVCLRSRRPVDLDTLPLPVYDDFSLDQYTEKDLLPIVMSRGCVNACHFCCDWQLKRPFRTRKPELVINEIENLRTQYNRRRFEFCDLLLNGDMTQLTAICDLLIEKNIDIVWGGQVMVRPEMTKAFCEKLKRAGCGGLTFGFESFSDTLLRAMNKRFTTKEAAQVIRNAKQAGLLVEANLLVGFPGETEEDIDATIQFLTENSVYIDRINSLNICSIGPGMTVWERADAFGIDKDVITDWYAWHTADKTNTLDVRLARHKKIKDVIQQKQLGLAWENIRREKSYITAENKEPANSAVENYEVIKAPSSCILLLTLACDLHCKMCYLWTNHEEKIQRPSVAEWKRFIDSIDACGEKPFTIIFGGGEPLLFKEELITLIAYAHEKGFRTSLATSGYAMDEITVMRLCAAGLDYIAFSIYSLSAHTQDFLRGVKGSLANVKNAIDYFAYYGPHVEVAVDTVFMEPNRNDLVGLTKWVQRNKRISRIMFQAVMQPFHTPPEARWYEHERYRFLWPRDVTKMLTVIDKVMRLKQREEHDGNGKITNSLSQFEVFKEYFRHPQNFIKKQVCPTHNNGHFGIAPDGAITLCPYMKPIGNIKEQTLQDIWNSLAARERRREIRSCSQNCHHIINCWYEEEVSCEAMVQPA